MSSEPLHNSAAQVLEYLSELTRDIEKARLTGTGENYQAYLHGQLYGAALVARLLFPGPGGLGEKAAFMARPLITEHDCRCDDDNQA